MTLEEILELNRKHHSKITISTKRSVVYSQSLDDVRGNIPEQNKYYEGDIDDRYL